MNKPTVFDYISQMEENFKVILKTYPFRDLITNEILNSSIIAIRELDNSSFGDLDTAKNMVRMQINSFFEPKSIQRVINKYWNDSVTYGFTMVNPTKENLLKFRQAVDTSIPAVVEVKHSLMNSIERFKPRNKPHRSIQITQTIKVSFFVFVLIVAFLFALNGRYSHVGGLLYFDKWTKEIKEYEVIK